MSSRPHGKSVPSTRRDLEEKIRSLFGTDVVVMTDTKATGRCPSFEGTMTSVSAWVSENSQKIGALKKLRQNLGAFAEEFSVTLNNIWYRCHMDTSGSRPTRRDFTCTKSFASYCLARVDILRKCCLLYCIHQKTAEPWERMSISFMVLADLIRRIDLSGHVEEVVHSLAVVSRSFDAVAAIGPNKAEEEEDSEEEGESEDKDAIPTYWWGESELISMDYGEDDFRSELLVQKSRPIPNEGEVTVTITDGGYTAENPVEMGTKTESICAVM